MMSSRLRVLIVGCGNIAGAFDEGRSISDFPFTHAGAYTRDDRFVLAACVEPNDDRRVAFMMNWGVTAGFRSIEDAFNSGSQFDVISICSPTICHEHDLETALQFKPRLIFCEKPVTDSVAHTERLVAECNKEKVLLAVNHTRAWDPDIAKLQASLLAGQWGYLRSVVGFYNKGILNNGSHMVDLLLRLVGPLKIVKVGKPTRDFFTDDPTVPAWLEGHQGVPVQFACGDARDYSIFELQFVLSRGVLTMESGGMFWRERCTSNSDTFRGYLMLDEGIRRAGGYSRAMLLAIDNVYQAIHHNETLASTGKSALAAQRLCEQIKLQAWLE